MFSYLKIVSAIAFFWLMFGMVIPGLISADNTLSVIGGIVGVVTVPAALVLLFSKVKQ